MRITLTLDDRLARQLKKRAAETRRTFQDVVNEVLARGMSATPATPPERYCLPTYSMGQVLDGVDLTKAVQLAAALDDEEEWPAGPAPVP